VIEIEKPGKKNRELLYLSLILAIAFLFVFISVSFDFYDRIFHFLSTYKELPNAKVFINVVFLFLVSSLLLLYRRWRLSERKKGELEDIIGV
jgi:TRAP-type C4-dicarboxylate transport system permease small subunit